MITIGDEAVMFDEIDMYSGLAALHWSAYDDPTWDHDFYRRIVEQAGGLALDVACGAGRLLRRYLQAGLAVEGLDSSADMLAVCRQKAEAGGVLACAATASRCRRSTCPSATRASTFPAAALPAS